MLASLTGRAIRRTHWPVKISAWHRALALLVFAGGLAGFLAWKCLADPQINFLPRDSRADWIILSMPFRSAAHPVVSIDASFRRDFVIEQVPSAATLEFRAA